MVSHSSPMVRPAGGNPLDSVTSALAVVAHPDDESFGLGALLGSLADRRVPLAVLCLTRGEASTLGDRPGDLAAVRAAELHRAAAVLGVDQVELRDHPDGGLGEVDLSVLTDQVLASVASYGPSHLLVFDEGGITGHPDHARATSAAVAAAERAGLPVLAWAVPSAVATRLNAEFGTSFVGRAAAELHAVPGVGRSRQVEAIACHHSQSTDNPVLRRRLELLGDTEYLRVLRPAGQ